RCAASRRPRPRRGSRCRARTRRPARPAPRFRSRRQKHPSSKLASRERNGAEANRAMNTTQAIVLGIVQGLGEFLPISSSGHLIVVPWLLGWPDHGLAFDVALHVGTLAAVLYAFFDDWRRLIVAGLRGIIDRRPFADPDSRLLWLLAMA